MFDISNPVFHDAAKARAYLENLRWADGRFCPHCGEAERTSAAKAIRGADGKRLTYQQPGRAQA